MKKEQPDDWLPGRIERGGRRTGIPKDSRPQSRGEDAWGLGTGVRNQNTPFPPAPPVTGSHLPPGWKPGDPIPTESRAWAQYERLCQI